LKRECRNKERTIVENLKVNPKLFWKYIGSKLKVKSTIPKLKRQIQNEIVLAESNIEKAELLVTYFSEVFTEESDVLSKIEYNYLVPGIPFQLHEITEEKVDELLRSLDVSKSPGRDDVHPFVLRELHSSLARPLSIIFSNPLHSGSLPRQWKEAVVVPIFRKGD
jgi:hypothetical protein